MSKPAGCSRKSKPLWMPRVFMLDMVLLTSSQTRKTIRLTANTW
jgi:hypothetical protein